NYTATIPFVLLTNNSSYSNIRNVMNLGFDDYIVKPFENETILKLINTRLEKQEKIIDIADEKFNYLMDHSVSGIYIYQEEKLKYVNKTLCQILGYTNKELLGINLVNIIYKDDIQIVSEKITKCIKGIYKDLSVRFEVIRKDQKVIKIELIGNILNIRNKKSLIGSIREIKINESKSIKTIKSKISLTKRETEILKLICDGYSNIEIAKRLHISERTSESHRANILSKTNSKNSVRLAIFAIKHGIYKI
ncbi:MAG: LuxR C-terminal-related transcriptional regulator, partial [Bacteroidota bacterium]|nr:LuxR C-terminal-related transcriptional regulator [Bacteroidota bacterium]